MTSQTFFCSVCSLMQMWLHVVDVNGSVLCWVLLGLLRSSSVSSVATKCYLFVADRVCRQHSVPKRVRLLSRLFCYCRRDAQLMNGGCAFRDPGTLALWAEALEWCSRVRLCAHGVKSHGLVFVSLVTLVAYAMVWCCCLQDA